MVFKQLLQAEAIDVCQIDSCRLAGVSEVLSVLFMAAKCVSHSLMLCGARADGGIRAGSGSRCARTRAASGCAST